MATTPSAVLALAQGMGRGTRFERARAGATTLSAFLQLDAAAKRELAVAVAQRVAPELVPRIQAETGLDFTQEQSRAVLDMVRRLDGDDLAELAASLDSPEARSRTAAAVAAAAATATGLDDVVPPSPAATEPTPGPAPPAPAAGSRDDGPDTDLLQRIAALEAKLGETETEALRAMEAHDQVTAALEEARTQVTTLERRLLDADEELAALRRTHAGEVEALERDLRDARRDADGAASRAGPAPTLASSTPVFESPAQALAAHAPDDAGLRDSAPVAVSAHRLAQDIEGLSAGAALRHVRGQVDRLGDLPTEQLAAILQAIPDGWARRRALSTMVEGGAAGPDDVALLRLVERTGDQVFAGAAFLGAGVPFAAVAEQLDPRAAARLQRRRA